jgi:ankyrin repeat protein
MSQAELNSALVQAADCELADARVLLHNGANPSGMPLIMAIQCGAKDIVQLMLKHGAKINEHHLGTTPLIRAITSGYPEIVSILIESGAEALLLDANNKSPLQWLNECNMSRLTDINKQKIADLLKGAKQILRTSKASASH